MLSKNSFLSPLKRFWPQLAIVGVVLLLVITNLKPGTWLTGWDNLHPEFAFDMNIKRSLFAVWQEYQGLGLLGGMGHASDLIRQVFLALLSLVIPVDLLRYLWTFLMLLSGALGMYYFLRQTVFTTKDSSLIPFLGSLFYLLNIATIQTFFVPFEAFIAHFGFLPWMLLVSLLYVEKRTSKRLLFLGLVLLLATPAAYIPTLFVVYLLALGVLLGTKLLVERKKELIHAGLKLGLIIFLINAFWLLPFIHFTLTNSQVNLNSKINQMATQTIYQQNKEFGDIVDTMLLKGFWFNNVDPNFEQEFTYMLAPWRDHYSHFMVPFSGILLFSIVCLGLVTILRKRQRMHYPFIALFLFCLTVLAVATPPFSIINLIYREAIPLLNQAFRFPFTKFSLLTAFSYTILLSIGLTYLLDVLKRKSSLRKATLGTVLLTGILLVITSFPLLQGHLFYEKEKLAIPGEYFAVFDFFKQQNPQTRIANFPQHTFWGWSFYDWGYGGSGFLWYGIKQPILDRAFDVWSAYDENYYFEVSQALYAKDASSLEQVFQKYQINWLLVDHNSVNPLSPRALYLDELETLLKSLPSVKKHKQFGDITIYQVSITPKVQNFVFATSTLPTINAYDWNHDDRAYQDYGTYQTSSSPQILYPFRSLSSQKTELEQDFRTSITPQTVTLEPTQSFTLSQPATLTVPAYHEVERILPLTLTASRSGEQMIISATVTSPEVWDGSTKLFGDSFTQPVLQLATTAIQPHKTLLSVNGIFHMEIKEGILGTTFLSLDQDNLLSIGSGSAVLASEVILASDLRALPQLQQQSIPLAKGSHVLKVVYPRIDDSYLGMRMPGSGITQSILCDEFRNGPANLIRGVDTLTFMAVNATSCASFYMSSLAHDQSYVVAITQRNLRGRGLHFWVLNQDTQYAPLDLYLPIHKDFRTTSFIVPPQEDFGQAYSFHFDNASIGNDRVENEVKEVTIAQIPYRYLKEMVITTDTPSPTKDYPLQEVSHPTESTYLLRGDLPQAATIVLSQAYDSGWQAYRLSSQPLMHHLGRLFPFIFAERLPEHVMINNWENGWILSSEVTSNDTLIITYLPQYLEYLGFIILIPTFGVLLYRLRKKT